MKPHALLLDPFRFELLPFGTATVESARLRAPQTLTVTCSPKHGPDRTVEIAVGLAAQGHAVVPHLAARMVRGRGHLDELLERLAAGGIRDLFVIGGDATTPAGPYRTSRALITDLREHALRPRSIGIAGYPEGHPLIADDVLLDDLIGKAPAADYLTTQMCFDASALRSWLERIRGRGVELPAYVGLPGAVDRRRLLEISLRVGVGSSISFLRKQPNTRRLLGSRPDATAALFDAVVPEIGGPLGVAGIHFFTFNRLVETVDLAHRSPTEHESVRRS